MSLAFSGNLRAAEQLSADAIKSLLTNNTTHCKNIQKSHASRVYFRDDGTATRLNHEGKKIPGNWRVTDAGLHCVDWGEEERCLPVIELGNGSYQKIENDKPRAEFTVIEGNPDSL